jgi:hypothetical protein
VSKRKYTPAHARPESAEGADGAGDGAPLATALRDLGPPRHGNDFWSGLDRRLADEPQLRLAPRSAIRPITQPPPVIDDRNLVEGLKGGAVPPPRRWSGRKILAAAAAVLVGLLILAAVQRGDGDPVAIQDEPTDTTADPAADDAAGDDDADAGDDDAEASTTEAPTTTAPPDRVEDDAPLAPAGVGPLDVGRTMADLQAAGLVIQPDQAEFSTSGGSCYSARVAGALDLRLRFRAPDEVYGVEDPAQGVLTAVTIEQGLPTVRTSDIGIALGESALRVIDVYGEGLDERSHPHVPGGQILRVDNGDGTGIAYLTDGTSVIGITVGEYDVIRFIYECG